MKKYFRDPPEENIDLDELLHFIKDHGVGQVLDNDGTASSWTDTSLEDAFSAAGEEISARAIQSWMSGAHIPSVKKLRMLARVIGGNKAQISAWTDALIAARRLTLDTKKKAQVSREETPLSAATPTPPSAKSDSTDGFARLKRWGWLALAAAALAALAAFFIPSRAKQIEIVDFKICDAARFSKEANACLKHVDTYPGNLKTVFVSFRLKNAESGQPFERRWYKGGTEYMRRSSYYDGAWPGWTFSHQEDYFLPGEYALRVIAGTTLATQTFTVAEPSADDPPMDHGGGIIDLDWHTQREAHPGFTMDPPPTPE